MDNGLTAHTAPFEWRDLYLQALFETDPAAIHCRISQAERALIRREHDLFTQAEARAEREAIINALNALNALRSCLGMERAAKAA